MRLECKASKKYRIESTKRDTLLGSCLPQVGTSWDDFHDRLLLVRREIEPVYKPRTLLQILFLRPKVIDYWILTHHYEWTETNED